jgi:predicted RNase H-like HicB family nuclease
MRAKFDVEATMIPIEFAAIIFHEGKSFVAHCPELEVSSCGHNLDEARGNLKTTVRLFVEEAEKLGTLNDILKEAGCQRGTDGTWKSLRIVATEVMLLTA